MISQQEHSFAHSGRDFAPPASDGTSKSNRRRILITEDNPVNQLIAQKLLEIRGFDVDVAVNGREALEAIAEKSYDLVLMDCQMPELDGYETTRRIRQHHKGGKLPVIALTAHAGHGDRERCLAAGMDDYIAKPFREAILSAVLERWLGAYCASQ